MSAARTVILNTSILYIRMLVTVGLTFYITRQTLLVLGVLDYGIYNLVSGVVAMLSFLNSAMSTSTQRFLSYHQGKEDKAIQKQIFATSIALHIAIGFILVIFIEVIGLFLFNGFLNIPQTRLEAAQNIYHLMGISVLFTVISVPFTASLNANENMLGLSVISFVEVLLKLTVVLLISKSEGDLLIIYGQFMAGITFISLVLYAIYCLNKYQECTLNLRRYLNATLIKDLTGFAGWNLFGALTSVGKTQGVSILLNVFFGSTINASYGVASQVSGQMNFFSSTLLKALNPRIMKSEGAGDRALTLTLSMIASKFSYYLLAFVAIPCIFEMNSILALWLKIVPPHTATFCSLILVAIMINQFTIGLDSAAQAIGKIRSYMIVAGTIKLLIVPVGFFLLMTGSSPISVLVGYASLEAVAGVARLYLLKQMTSLRIKIFLSNVITPAILPTLSLVLSLTILTNIGEHHLRFLITIPISILIFFICIYLFGLSKDEKNMINAIVNKFQNKMSLKWG